MDKEKDIIFERFKDEKTGKFGFSGFKDVLSVLIGMVVHSEKTVHSYLSGFFGKEISMKKDVFYRLKNRETIC